MSATGLDFRVGSASTGKAMWSQSRNYFAFDVHQVEHGKDGFYAC
jgi:hypothetical protein